MHAWKTVGIVIVFLDELHKTYTAGLFKVTKISPSGWCLNWIVAEKGQLNE
jgi:hypothetical protein